MRIHTFTTFARMPHLAPGHGAGFEDTIQETVTTHNRAAGLDLPAQETQERELSKVAS
ncbi:MAG: hypothetical protein FWG94_03485 [Oscillospiraceae bacterium]|nr:hypothetical protein [Oscillospiraceae bacterium]